jgi:hypothetical protein
VLGCPVSFTRSRFTAICLTRGSESGDISSQLLIKNLEMGNLCKRETALEEDAMKCKFEKANFERGTSSKHKRFYCSAIQGPVHWINLPSCTFQAWRKHGSLVYDAGMKSKFTPIIATGGRERMAEELCTKLRDTGNEGRENQRSPSRIANFHISPTCLLASI